MSDSFISLLCLVNFFVFSGAVLLFGWTRGAVAKVRTRLTVVESQLAKLHQTATPMGQAVVTATTLNPSGAMVSPAPVPASPVPLVELPPAVPELSTQERWPEIEVPTPPCRRPRRRGVSTGCWPGLRRYTSWCR